MIRYPGRIFAVTVIVTALASLALSRASAQFDSLFDSPGAAEQFRLGVQAYHKGRYSESILLFEKALAYAPEQALIQFWRGRAYYKCGFEETALRAWQDLVDRTDAPPSLRAKAELVRGSRAIAPRQESYRYIEVARYEGKIGAESFFSRPSALATQRDGSVLVVAHGSNEVVRIDGSGLIRERTRGGMAGLDRPFGLAALPDGTLFVTEFNGDRIARIGTDGSIKSYGSRGRGPGGLIGPQFATLDSSGYLYVVDYGNSRICKFDPEGAFILDFGKRVPESDFPGLSDPTGILAYDGVVYIADAQRRCLYRFDESGNFLGTLVEGVLHRPEGLALWEGGRSILVADTDRIVSVGIESEAALEVYRSPDRKARLVGAAPDQNGNLLVCDFDASYVAVLSELSLLASGYDVEIQRIVADAYPKIVIDVDIRDKNGTPIVGLSTGNFHLSERIKSTKQDDEGGKAVIRTEESLIPASEAIFLGSGDGAKGARIVLLLERSAELAAEREPLRSALVDLYSTLSTLGTLPSLVTAGPAPAFLGPGDPASTLRAAIAPQTGHGRFDLGLRLAVTQLLPSGNRDAVVYIGTGRIDEASFSGLTLSELASFLRNNGLRFYAVVLDEPSDSLRYLSERSGGEVYSAARPQGLGELGAAISSAPSGRYRLSFVSKADTAFGRAYLSVGVEAYLYKKSGKDELGFFAPLR